VPSLSGAKDDSGRIEGEDEMGASAPPLAGPSYIPAGYRLQAELFGPIFMAFGGKANQYRWTYTKGLRESHFTKPLFIYMSPPENSPVLAGTEKQRGQPIELGVPGTKAVYHDGLWQIGPGYDQRFTGDVFVHWDFSDQHSLTVRHDRVLFAARGSRLNDISVDELVRIAISFDYASAAL
jgi:hypothetical protein